jgi:hypothetical protein
MNVKLHLTITWSMNVRNTIRNSAAHSIHCAWDYRNSERKNQIWWSNLSTFIIFHRFHWWSPIQFFLKRNWSMTFTLSSIACLSFSENSCSHDMCVLCGFFICKNAILSFLLSFFLSSTRGSTRCSWEEFHIACLTYWKTMILWSPISYRSWTS